jgi:tetratricopeptide (TPR) repeat protein
MGALSRNTYRLGPGGTRGGGPVPERVDSYSPVYATAKRRLEDQIAADRSALAPRLELAQLAYVEGDFETALAVLTEASEIDSENPRVHIRLGDVLTESGRHDEALASYRKAESLASGSPLEPEAKLERELQEREARLVHTPLAEAESASGRRAPDASGLNVLGCLYLAAGRVEDAGAAFRRAVEADESSLQAALNLGFVQGLAAVEPVRLKRSVKELTAAAERFPDEPRLQLHLAELYEASSLYDAAIQRIMRALLTSKNCMEAYDLAARYVLLGGGREAPLEKRIDEIVADAKRDLAAAPADSSKKKQLALALVGRYRYRSSSSSPVPDSGRADLERARTLLEEVSDGDEETAVRLAECRERLGGVDGAERLLRDAAERHPDSYRPRFELAGLRLRIGQPDEAVELFAQAIELAREEAVVYQSIRFALSSSRKLRLTELSSRRELELNPRNVDALLELGTTYIDALRHDAAIETLRKAVEFAPGRADAHVALGRSLTRTERSAEAEQCFRTAISLEPDLAEAYKSLGNLLVDLPGRMREGLEAFDRYRALKARHGRG